MRNNTVYQAANEEIARDEFEKLKNKWQNLYPYAIKSWENNWDVLSPFYKFPEEVRKIMYTTNIIEGFHRQLRKVTKSKTIFPSDEALEKNTILGKYECVKEMDSEI